MAKKKWKIGLTVLLLLAAGLPLSAYIGPGAGFAFLSSFLVLFLTFFLAVFSFLSWPFRLLFRLVKSKKTYKTASRPSSPKNSWPRASFPILPN
jgi:hypothetical protein